MMSEPWFYSFRLLPKGTFDYHQLHNGYSPMIRSLWFRRLRRWLFLRPAKSIRMRRETPRTRLQLEPLEDRTLLTAYTVTSLTDTGVGSGTSGDIRYCINQANIPTNNNSTITFSSSLPGKTITLTQGELQISDNMTITGLGATKLTISGGHVPFGSTGFRVFDITSNNATVTISGLTITAGNASPAVNFLGNQGGDIFNGGNLTLSNDIISNGQATGFVGGPIGRGGGIFNAQSATLLLDNTVVKSNLAGTAFAGFGGQAAGGGIYNDVGALVILQGGTQVINNRAQ